MYAPNIPIEQRHLWHIMVDSLPKDCSWIIGGDFNMTKRPNDNSNDCGRAISDLEDIVGMSFLIHFKTRHFCLSRETHIRLQGKHQKMIMVI